MKKNKIIAVATTSIMVSGMISGCAFEPKDNMESCVYGPPPSKDINVGYDNVDNINEPQVKNEETAPDGETENE